MYCLSLYIETCMEPVCLVFKPVWNLEVLSCLVLSCLTPDFCLALICLDFVYLYKRGVLYAQTVLAQILSFAIISLTRPQAAPNVTLVSEVGSWLKRILLRKKELLQFVAQTLRG